MGGAPLTVSAATTTGAWTIAGFSPPVTIAPGGSTAFTVTGQGSGSLTLESDTITEPVLTIPLETGDDLPPTLALVDPVNGDILEPGDRVMQATVGDSEDAPEDIAITWRSDVDGPIADGFADSTGTMSATWAAGRTEGDHLLTETATDTCGNTAGVDVGVCQQAGYTVDELDISSWNFEGSAAWNSTENWLRLTPVADYQVGSAFATSSTVRADSVQIELRVLHRGRHRSGRHLAHGPRRLADDGFPRRSRLRAWLRRGPRHAPRDRHSPAGASRSIPTSTMARTRRPMTTSCSPSMAMSMMQRSGPRFRRWKTRDGTRWWSMSRLPGCG